MDYSQNQEQLKIENYFKNKDQSELTFLDIGANDGITLSNTHNCALLGWNGVCVEPAPIPFKKLKKLYKGSKIELVNYAISDKVGTAIFYDSGTHLNNGDTSLLSSLKESEMKQWKKETFTQIKVKTTTFNEMLKECNNKTFDLISLDAEGLDYEILTQIDLDLVKCQMLIVEWNNKDKFKFIMYARKFGMKLIHSDFINLIFTR